MHAEIAGGGLGALATATALAQRGWSVRVHEKQDTLQAVGAGIYIWENGLRVLEALGAYEQATASTHRGVMFETREDGKLIDQNEIPPVSRVFSIPREQLLESLETSAKKAGVEIVLSSEAVGASPSGELHFADGHSMRGDLIVGVDGVGSLVRESLDLRVVRDLAPEGAIRTMIPVQKADLADPDWGKYIENWNGDRRLLVTPVSNEAVYLALTCMDTDEDAKRIPVNKRLWSEAFPDWSHYIDRIEEAHWGIYTVVKLNSWSSGQVALVGDAAHAQMPNLAQGGSMAMQNGLGLAVALEKAHTKDSIPNALKAWEQKERPLIDHCQKWASLYGEVAFLPDEIRASVLTNPWVNQQLFKAAASTPTGTPIPSQAHATR